MSSVGPQDAIGGSMGSPTVLAAKHGAKAQVTAAFASSLAAKVPKNSLAVRAFVAADTKPTNLQSFRMILPHNYTGMPFGGESASTSPQQRAREDLPKRH